MHVGTMQRHQPHRRIRGPDRYSGPYVHPLAFLRDLSNVDKHRVITPAVLAPWQISPSPEASALAMDYWYQTTRGEAGPIEPELALRAEIMRVKMPDPDNPRGEPIDRPVEVGLTDGEWVVIRDGLSEEDRFYIKLPQRIGRNN